MSNAGLPKGHLYVTRLAWNIDGWAKPSGARTKERGTHVATRGFGHEEWLARTDCEINGWRYGFLQGVQNQRKRLAGKTLNILLYSIHPKGDRLYVGELSSAEVIDTLTQRDAQNIFRRQGLGRTMKQEVADAGGKGFTPGVNIRFRPDALKIYKNQLLAPSWDRILRFHRYAMLQGDGRLATWWKSTSAKRKPWSAPPSIDPVVYKRAARLIKMERTEARMQQEIKAILEKRFDKGRVEAERNRRDLTVEADGRHILIELKASEDAKLAIREALGQVLEYAHFDVQNQAKAHELLIIARGPSTPEVRQYLIYLESRFGLAIKYLQYQIGSKKLGPI